MQVEKTSGVSTPVPVQQAIPSSSTGNRQLVTGAQSAIQPVQGNRVELSTFVATTDNRLLSPADFKRRIVAYSSIWANASLETLFDMLMKWHSTLPRPAKKKVRYGKKIVEMEKLRITEVFIPPEVRKECLKVGATDEQFKSFNADLNLLHDLQQDCVWPPILQHFPPVPDELCSAGSDILNIQLQQIRDACLSIVQDEYLVLARLFLAETIYEKMILLWDYLYPANIVRMLETGFMHYASEEREFQCMRALGESSDHYAYAVAGFCLLAERMQRLSLTQDKNALQLARLMLTYIDAAITVVQSRNDFVEAAKREKLHQRKGGGMGSEAKKMRFNMMLERIQPIRDELARHIENDLLPAYMEQTFHFKAPVSVKKSRKSTPSEKQGIRPKVIPWQAKPKQPRMPVEEVPVAPQAVETVVETVMTEQVEAEPPVTPESAEEAALLAIPEQAEAQPDAKTEESAILPSTSLSADTSAAPILIPVAEMVSQAVPVMQTDNPRLAGLQPRYRAIYDQVFFSHWHEARDLTLDAVKKLVTRLGGQTKGVGGSRTQIIFNNKSVATIEHRHGRDRAGELYKVSVSLLQRGLGIAGFAPPGWADELSRTRDMLTSFWRYAAMRDAQGE